MATLGALLSTASVALVGDAPAAHAPSHKTGGADAIKLDELAAPTDVTTLNATSSAHGLLPKLSNVVTEFFNGQGGYTVPPGGGGGEANTASNVGTGGVGVWKDKVGVDLRFKKINAGSTKITITDDTGNNEVDVDADANVIVAASTDQRFWTYVKVTSADFTTTSATAVDVTGLAFTPAANTDYEFEAVLMVRTATTTVNPRLGLAWPTGLTDGVAIIEEIQAATFAPHIAAGNPNAALLIPVGGLPNTTQSWPAVIRGMVRAGATPSGNVRVQLATETAGTTVRVVIGSFLRYRIIP